MGKKVKCKKCGLMIDDDNFICPYCGYPLHDEEEQKEETFTSSSNKQPSNETSSTVETNEKKDNQDIIDVTPSDDTKKDKKKVEDHVEEGYTSPFKSYMKSLVHFPSREMVISPYKSLALFLIGFLGLNILAYFVELIIYAVSPEVISTYDTLSALNFGIYIILFGIFIMVVNKDMLPALNDYKHASTWAKGLLYGVILVVVSSLVTNLFYLFYQDSSSNVNETSIESITALYPVLSLIVFGIIGPICEEFTYRAGLFSLCKKLGRVPAYIICIIIFGLIHFDFDFSSTETIINELINLPTYMVAGGLLCYFYEKGGISTSIIAHVFNNVVSILMTIILVYA